MLRARLSVRQGVTEADVAAARRDDARIRQFFAAYTKPEKVCERVCRVCVLAGRFPVSRRRRRGHASRAAAGKISVSMFRRLA